MSLAPRALVPLGLALVLQASACVVVFESDYELEDQGSTSSGPGGGGFGVGGSGALGGSGGAGGQSELCAPGTFATGFTEGGKLSCETIDAATIEAVNANCTVYAGWKDGCTDCADPPTKWGTVSAAGCTLGVGNDDTCQSPTLDGKIVHLFGLNTNGVVNSDDRFFYGFSCAPGSSATSPGPCAAGELLQGYDGVSSVCVPASGAIMDFVRAECSLYVGMRDGCDADCTSAPATWGRISTSECFEPTGDPNACTTPELDGVAVSLIGLNTSGTVDGNNKFYSGLDCREATPATDDAVGVCPAGQVVVGIEADGLLHCASPAPAVAAAFADHCTLYSGWRDQCQSGCLADGQLPAKWGRVWEGVCSNDQGNDNTCQTSVLDGESITTFGLNTDGFVSEADKFFTGFACD